MYVADRAQTQGLAQDMMHAASLVSSEPYLYFGA